MFGIVNYGGFLISSILINMIPGPDSIYILTKSIVGGKKTGFMSTLGTCTGTFCHTLFASLGLSAILASSNVAFASVKFSGAFYLMFIGIKSMFSKDTFDFSDDGKNSKSGFEDYKQGVFTNLLNAKIILFFLAFMPQYISPDATSGFVPFFLLGLSFCCSTFLWSMVLVFLSYYVHKLLTKSEKSEKLAPKISGGIYFLMGLNVLRI